MEELARIAATLPSGPVVTYCNTGHWAATDWFVLSAVLGRPDVRLFAGSMVEWTADLRRPVASARTRFDDLKKKLGLGS
jgi:thiosulfate/3-mercaptopyruvate sulfurtransferase